MNENENHKFEREGSVESVEQSKQHPAYQIPRVSSRLLVGPGSPLNNGAAEWGSHGLLAYGSNTSIVIVDTRNMQHIQTLDKHKVPVQRLIWERQNMNTSNSSLGLISSDSQGLMIIWDIESGQQTGTMQDGSKPILDLGWVSNGESNDLLLALHPPYSLLLWDVKTRTKLWKKTYTESLISFSLDPFDHSKLAFLCQDCVLFVEDFSVIRTPSSNGRKFYVSTPQNPAEKRTTGGGSDTLKRLVKDLVLGETKPKSDEVTVSECLQLQYHKSLRHHLLLLYAKELLILDLHINQTVGIIPLDRSSSPFLQVLSVRSRNLIYLLHESGSISVKTRKRVPKPALSPVEHHFLNLETQVNSTDLVYDGRCQSEILRLHKNNKILGFTYDTISESKLALILSSGKVVFLELGKAPMCMMKTLELTELVEPYLSEGEDLIENLRLQITGLMHSVGGPLTVIRMCPALTTRNWQNYDPLMAGGTDLGIVQIFNMATGIVEKEFAIHSFPVKGIEWTGLKSFLSYSCGPALSTGLVRNELSLTDVHTGNIIPLRSEALDEPPIDIIRVSPLKQYFVLCLKFATFELWDLKNLCVLRTMPKKFPLVTALEWSPVHNLKSLRRKSISASLEDRDQEDSASAAALLIENGRCEITEKQIVAREHFVFTDTENQLFHFSVEGNVMKDGIKIPPEAGVGGVTCIAFKNDLIVQGDTDGVLNIWDLKARSSRNVHTGRGMVKKMRFAPGKGNVRVLLLYNDGVDIIDLKKQQYERISQLRTPRDIVKIIDVDWAASDKPVLATQDGCLRIMDIALQTCVSPLTEYIPNDPIFCPALLSRSALLNIKTCLTLDLCNLNDLDNLTGLADNESQALRDQIAQYSDSERNKFNDEDKITKRALLAAKMFGTVDEIDLWNIIDYYIQVYKEQGNNETEGELETKRVNKFPHIKPLDTCYDLLCDPYSYQMLQLSKAILHEARRGDYNHTKQVVENLILLGQTDRAVQLLLETELDNPNYYTDAIKACLVATIQSTGAAQSTIKLVATNLIANNNIWEGVQLLCLIGKGLDACRYLSSYGLWDKSAWLAKSALNFNESDEVLKKWAENLSSSGKKIYGAQVMITLGRFNQAASFLLSAGLPVQSQLLIQACIQNGISVEKPIGLDEEIKKMFSCNLKILDALLA